MQIMTYEEWLKYHRIEKIIEDCLECEGAGVDECWSCRGEKECKECEGTGEIDLTFKEYSTTKVRDTMAWERYERWKKEVQE